MSRRNWTKYIFWFAQEHVDFRESEIQSLVKLFNINWEIVCDGIEQNQLEKPFWVVNLPDENAAKAIASRSVSLRCVLELWGWAQSSNSIDKLHKQVSEYIHDNEENVNKFFQIDSNFKITVDTYNKHFSQKEKVQKIETFSYLPIKGDVNLRNPNVEWWYIEFYGLNPKEVPEEPYDVLFGRWIADGQRNLIKELSLKSRKFIGNTSMDAQLSLLMANQGLVKNGDLVLDPFVGTGSLLVSAAKFGGYVIGADIDYLTLHALSRPSRISQKIREKDESVRANLKQYGCEDRYVDILVADFSNCVWTDNIQFDCIITDPPYGIREATTKIETKCNKKGITKCDEDVVHFPSTSHYSLHELYEDLLEFSAHYLKLSGRLVCWLPVFRDDYSDYAIPAHKNLKLLSNCEQVLNGLASRRLLTYEKISCPAYKFHRKNSRVKHEENKKIIIEDFRPKYFCYADGEKRTSKTEFVKNETNGSLMTAMESKKENIKEIKT